MRSSGVRSGSWSGGGDATWWSYLALAVASNLVACGCEGGTQSPVPRRVSDEPVILTVSAPAADPAAPAPDAGAARRATAPLCGAAYRPRGIPRWDAARLGALCGPSHGLAPGPVREVRARGERLLELRVQRAECVWVVAAQAPARPIELRWTVGDEQLAACELRD